MKVYSEFDDQESEEYNEAYVEVINFIDSLDISEIPLHQGTCDVTEIYDFQTLGSNYNLTQEELDKIIDNAEKWLNHRITSEIYPLEERGSVEKKVYSEFEKKGIDSELSHEKEFEEELKMWYEEFGIEKEEAVRWMDIGIYSPVAVKRFKSNGVSIDDIEMMEVESYGNTDTMSFTDGRRWFNTLGQQLRSPEEYNERGEGYTPFGDEG